MLGQPPWLESSGVSGSLSERQIGQTGQMKAWSVGGGVIWKRRGTHIGWEGS